MGGVVLLQFLQEGQAEDVFDGVFAVEVDDEAVEAVFVGGADLLVDDLGVAGIVLAPEGVVEVGAPVLAAGVAPVSPRFERGKGEALRCRRERVGIDVFARVPRQEVGEDDRVAEGGTAGEDGGGKSHKAAPAGSTGAGGDEILPHLVKFFMQKTEQF